MTFDDLVHDIRNSTTKLGHKRAFTAALQAAHRLYEEERQEVGQAEAQERFAARQAAVAHARDEWTRTRSVAR